MAGKTFTQLLSNYVEFSNEDYQTAMKWERSLQGDARTIKHLASGHGGGMGSLPIQVGNVEISQPTGIQLKHPTTGKRTVWADPKGDFWVGSDVDTPADTTMIVLSNAQTYNGEALGVGDLLLGDNSTGKANLFWDRSAGTLSLRYGTTTSVELSDGGISAIAGTIGGWTIGPTTLSATGVVLDAGNEKITVGSGTPNIVIDGANKLIKSSNYVTRNAGWQIKSDGSAEFQDVFLRGSLQAVSFEKLNVNAVGGIVRAVKGSGLLTADFTTPGSIGNPISGGITIKNNNDGTAVAAVDDVLYIYYFDGTNFSYMWATVTAVGASSGGSRVYSADFEGGSWGHTFPTGEVCTNLGGAGGVGGYTDIEGGSTPRVAVYSHTGTPWAGGGETVRFVAGNLDGYYGVSSDYFGMGVGDYDSGNGNFLTYNADGLGKFILQAGDGAVTITADGISIVEGDASPNAIEWLNSAKTQTIGSIWSEDVLTAHRTSIITYGTVVNDNAEILLGAYADSGDSASITLDASATSLNSLVLYSNSHSYWTHASNKGLSISGGLYVGSGTIPSTIANGDILSGVGVRAIGGAFRTEGATLPTGYTGDGVEIAYVGGTHGRIIGYDRTGGHYTELRLAGDPLTLYEGSTKVLTVDGGDVYTNDFADYSASASVSGWSSFTVKEVYYKTIGDIVFVWFYLNGTSNATGKTFNVPYYTQNSANNVAQAVCRVANNGTPAVGFINLPQNSRTVTIYRSMVAGTGWTASGNAFAIGQFCYQRA